MLSVLFRPVDPGRAHPFRRLLPCLLAVAAILFTAGWGSQAAATVRISVDLSAQRMIVTNSKGDRFNWAISSGRTGYVTPRGAFRPQSLRRMHFSSRYNNAPMPHSIFFHKGWAIHGTNAVRDLGRPASHGCIRLAPGSAAKLFAMVQREGAIINIHGRPPHMTNMATAKPQARKVRAVKAAGPARIARSQLRATRTSAGRGPSRRTPVANSRRSAEPMAFAPARRAPGFKVWQGGAWR